MPGIASAHPHTLPKACLCYRGTSPEGPHPWEGMRWHQTQPASITTLYCLVFPREASLFDSSFPKHSFLLQVTTCADLRQGEILMSLPPSQGLGKIYQDSPARGCGCPQIPGGPGPCHQTLDLPVLSLQEREEAPERCWLPDPANDMPDQYLGCFALGAGPAGAVRAALFTDNSWPPVCPQAA